MLTAIPGAPVGPQGAPRRGTLLFMRSADGARPGVGLAVKGAVAAAMPTLIANLALEIAPGAGQPHRRRLRRHVAVAALALHVMTDTALTGATYDVDGGQHLV